MMHLRNLITYLLIYLQLCIVSERFKLSYRGSRREWEFKEGFLEKVISESDKKE